MIPRCPERAQALSGGRRVGLLGRGDIIEQRRLLVRRAAPECTIGQAIPYRWRAEALRVGWLRWRLVPIEW